MTIHPKPPGPTPFDNGEVVLAGGHMSTVVQVRDTVRRDPGPWTPAVHGLLRHLQRVGFDGAPRVGNGSGYDDRGREVLSFVPGHTPAPPLPSLACTDEALVSVTSLLRRYHDCAAGFVPPEGAVWRTWLGSPSAPPEVVCHNDVQPGNVVFTGGRAVAFIDWDLSAPGPRLWDVASVAKSWVPLVCHAHRAQLGWPASNRTGPRLRLLCDTYGVEGTDRRRLVDLVIRRHRATYHSHRVWSAEGAPGFVRLWARGSGTMLLRDLRWTIAARDQLAAFLT